MVCHFTTNILISLLLPPVIIILLEIYRKSKKADPSVYLDAVPTSDLFVRFVLECVPLKKFHIAPIFFWFIISLSMGVIIPLFSGIIPNLPNTSGYFFTKGGFILTFNYTFIVPILFSAHFYLYSAACKFLDNKTLSDIGFITHNKKTIPKQERTQKSRLHKKILIIIKNPWNWYHISLILAASAIQFFVINSKINQPIPLNPYIDFNTRDLNWIGVLYYCLRGLNAYMALGILLNAIYICLVLPNRLRTKNPNLLFDNMLRIKKVVVNLGTALSKAMLMSFIVIAIHSIAAFNSVNNPLEQLFNSTCVFWSILFFIGTLICLKGLFWLHKILVDGIEAIEYQKLRKLSGNNDIEPTWELCPNIESRIELFSKYWKARNSLRQRLEQVNTWPLPKRGKFLITTATIFQALYTAVAAMSLLINF